MLILRGSSLRSLNSLYSSWSSAFHKRLETFLRMTLLRVNTIASHRLCRFVICAFTLPISLFCHIPKVFYWSSLSPLCGSPVVAAYLRQGPDVLYLLSCVFVSAARWMFGFFCSILSKNSRDLLCARLAPTIMWIFSRHSDVMCSSCVPVLPHDCLTGWLH